MKIPLNDIQIPPDRQRTQKDDKYISKLADSLRLVGLINPVVVDDKNTLLAGECRIRAARLNGWPEIEARRFSELDDLDKQLIELEENLRRSDLGFADEVRAKKKIHDLLQSKYGVSAQHGGKKGGWRVRDTASHLGISVGKMSQDVQLAKALEREPALAKQATKTAAIAHMNRQRAIGLQILANKIKKAEAGETTQPTSKSPASQLDPSHITLHHADCRDIIPALPDASINCLITDPPWGVAHDSSSTTPTRYDKPRSNGEAISDMEMMSDVIKMLYPKVCWGALCWLFCASKRVTNGDIYRMITDAGFKMHPYPIIWYKPKKAASSRPYDDIKQDFEIIVLFAKGDKDRFREPLWGVYDDTLERKPLHKNEKPLSLLKTLIRASTYYDDDLVCDPFMGSGKTMKAALEMDRHGVGIELDKQWYESSRALIGV